MPHWTRFQRRQRASATPDILPIRPMSQKTNRNFSRAKIASRRNRKRVSLKIVPKAKLPTRFGVFTIFGVKGAGPQDEAVALVHGKLNAKRSAQSAPLVRVHSQCLTGDVFHSLRCDCRAQLELALKKIT